MKTQLFSIVMSFSIVLVSIVQSGCNDDNTDTTRVAEGSKQVSQDEKVARGRYLVTIGGCGDCHSPKRLTNTGPVADSSKLLSGHPAGSKLPPVDMNYVKPGNWGLMAPDATSFVGPWGVSFAANLTSDSATGIGAWTEEVFVKALRTGKHLGLPNGRNILPPMPWPNLTVMTDEDFSSVYTYLRSLPAISNRVPEPIPPTQVNKLASK